MSRRYTDHDPEHYDRPRRHTRPRTKDRPDYTDAVVGQVLRVDRGRYAVLLPDGTPIVAMRARALGRKAAVVGDEVRVVGDTSGAEGTLARIVEVSPRRTVLRRTADDDDPYERIIVANADQLVIVVALADPEPRTGLIDRALVAAYDSGMQPLLCLTKADLADPGELLAIYRPLGVSALVTQQGDDISPVAAALTGRVSVMLGHSGVGKSTLVNALVPHAQRETGVVNDVTGRGRHTSTSAVMLPLPDGGSIIDTPGIRSFGLAHIEPDDIVAAFDDLSQATTNCPRGCTHAHGNTGCGLDSPDLDSDRVESLRRLLSARDATTY